MVVGRHPTKPIVWIYAVLLTLLLHVGVVLGAHVLRPFDPNPVPVPEPEDIQVVFAAEPESADKEPTFFTELPPDRAGESPDSPDFLSNVDSRASDNTAGGEDEGLPGLEGESEVPQVRMESGSLDSPPPQSESAARSALRTGEHSAAQEDTGPAESPPPDPLGEEASSEGSGSGPEDLSSRSVLFRRNPAETPNPLWDARSEEPDLEDAGSEETAPEVPEAPTPDAGDSDLPQDAMSNPEGNVLPYGDISLSTVAWDYAPWLQEFRRNLIRNWRAPYGYYLGVIHGWTFLELEIARSGQLLRMDVLGEEGHESLRKASVGVFLSTAPYRPLPAKFPEKSLILQIKLIYPERKN